MTDLQQGLARLEEAIEANAKPLEKVGAEATAAALPWTWTSSTRSAPRVATTSSAQTYMYSTTRIISTRC